MLLQRDDREEAEEEETARLESSRWRRLREAEQSAGSLSLTRWCSDLAWAVTWDQREDEEEFYKFYSQEEVRLTDREQEILNKQPLISAISYLP